MACSTKAISKLLDNEGGAFVSNDRGRGPSKWGITLATARVYTIVTNAWIENLTRDQAAAWYKVHYWDAMHLELIQDCAVATKILDLSVNIGNGTAVRLLQQVLIALGTHTAIVIDSIMGPKTITAVNGENPTVLLNAYREKAKLYYRDLVKKDLSAAKYLPGWLARVDA